MLQDRLAERALIVRDSRGGKSTDPNSPMGWIGGLVRCGCGHGIGSHFAQGCTGTLWSMCMCARNRDRVLDAAIDDVKD